MGKKHTHLNKSEKRLKGSVLASHVTEQQRKMPKTNERNHKQKREARLKLGVTSQHSCHLLRVNLIMLQEVGVKKIFWNGRKCHTDYCLLPLYTFHDNIKQLLLLVSLFKKPQTPKESFYCVFCFFLKMKQQLGVHFEFLWRSYALRTLNHQPQYSRVIMQKEETDISAEW